MAGALALAGCALPERLMPANFANPAGYWEPQEAADFDDAVLAAADSSWSDLFGPRGHRQRPPHRAEHVIEARELIRRDYAGKDLIVFKEPRATLLIDLWRTAATEEGYEPLFVIMVRHPAEAARSLAERDGITRNRGLLLWATYMLAAEIATRRDKRLFVAFDALLQNAESVLDRIEQAFGFAFPRRSWKTAAEIESFLRPDLVHQRRVDGLGAPALAPIEDLYAFLERAARGEKENADTPAEVAAWLDGLEETMGPILAQAEVPPSPPVATSPGLTLEELQAELAAHAQALQEARGAASAQAARTSAAIAALEQKRASLAGERDAALDKAAGLERDLAWKLDAAERDAARARERIIELEGERTALEVRLERAKAEVQADLQEAQGALADRDQQLAQTRREARKTQRSLAGRLARAQQRVIRADAERERLLDDLEAARRQAGEAASAAERSQEEAQRQAAELEASRKGELEALEEVRRDRDAITELEARLAELQQRSTWDLQSLVLRRTARIAARRLGFSPRRRG